MNENFEVKLEAVKNTLHQLLMKNQPKIDIKTICDVLGQQLGMNQFEVTKLYSQIIDLQTHRGFFSKK